MRKVFLVLIFILLLSFLVSAQKNLVKLELSVDGDKVKYYLNQSPVQKVAWNIKVTKLDASVRYVDVNLIRVKAGDVNRFSYTHPSLPGDKVIRFDLTSSNEQSYFYNNSVAGKVIDYMTEVKEPFFEPGAYYYYAVVTKVYDAPAHVIFDEVISDNSDTYAILVFNKKSVVSETNYFLVLLISLLAISILTLKSGKHKNYF
ncbi:MAG: hypothetical protein QXD98_03215 [Candidatus Diapherotrites archaeon]